MRFYQFFFVVIFFVSSSLSIDAFWSKWADAITAKISNSTDVIVHKEFKKAKQLELHNTTGTIVINSWKQDSIAIEIITSCPQTSHKAIKIDTQQLEETVIVHTIFTDEKIKGSVVFNILLPAHTDLAIFTKQGDIIIKDVHGCMNLETLHGTMTLINPHTTLDAKAHEGNIIIRTDSILADKEFNLESGKGDIEIYTTSALQTYLHASAPQGKVLSQIPITLESKTTQLNADAWKNFRQSAQGTIGQPLSKLNIMAHNGSISIMPYL
jgi:hypothetical protein